MAPEMNLKGSVRNCESMMKTVTTLKPMRPNSSNNLPITPLCVYNSICPGGQVGGGGLGGGGGERIFG